MVVPDGEREAVGRDSHSVIDEAKADGAVAEGGYPWAPPIAGGFAMLELPSREEAIAWAARIARACRCDHELCVRGWRSYRFRVPEMTGE